MHYSIQIGSQNSMMHLHYIYVFAVPTKGCIACKCSLLQSLSCLALRGAAPTHTEKAFFPNNMWSDQRLMPKANKRAGFTPGLSPHRLSGSMTQDKSKPLAKSNSLLSQSYLHRLAQAPRNHPFWYAFSALCIPFVHSKSFLALVVQTEPPGSHCRPKTLISTCAAVYQHCHGYTVIPT